MPAGHASMSGKKNPALLIQQMCLFSVYLVSNPGEGYSKVKKHCGRFIIWTLQVNQCKSWEVWVHGKLKTSDVPTQKLGTSSELFKTHALGGAGVRRLQYYRIILGVLWRTNEIKQAKHLGCAKHNLSMRWQLQPELQTKIKEEIERNKTQRSRMGEKTPNHVHQWGAGFPRQGWRKTGPGTST